MFWDCRTGAGPCCAGRSRRRRRGRQSDPELGADRGSFAVLLRQGAGLVREGRHRSHHRGRQGLRRLVAEGRLRRLAVRHRRSRHHAGGEEQGRRRRGADEHLRQYRADLLLAEELRRERREGFSGPQDRQPARRRLAGDVAGLRQGRGDRARRREFRQCRPDRQDRGAEEPHRRYHQRFLQRARSEGDRVRQPTSAMSTGRTSGSIPTAIR